MIGVPAVQHVEIGYANVRFKMTNKGEIAILSRKDYEILVAKAQEADEDLGTARLCRPRA
jgi:hypothetical protein